MDKNIVLLTGGAGYIGAHVAHQLRTRGYRVVIVDDLSSGNPKISNYFDLYVGDYGDVNLLTSIHHMHPFSSVIHLAAHTQVGESNEKPNKYYKNNMSSSILLFDFLIKKQINKLVFSSSAAVYGEPRHTLIAESHPKQPLNPYGKTKWMTEQILSDLHEAHAFHVTCLRYFNVAGVAKECMYAQPLAVKNVIPILFETMRNKVVFNVFGQDYPTTDGTCIRDYVHVGDIARAHVAALDQLYADDEAQFRCFNLGTNQGHLVLELIKVAEGITAQSLNYQFAPRRKGDAAILVADNRAAVAELGWQPKLSTIENIMRDHWHYHQRCV